MKKWILWILATVAVIIIYQICYGLATLRPSNINWLMTARHDWGTHYLGWAFYKNEAWHFPIGQVMGYNYPIGTNVGFTDSIPLMAIVCKLFAPLLSNDFQYFGFWLFTCHLLLAYYTILFCRLFRVNALVCLIAAIFVAANPELIHRGMHPALCAQWLIVGSLYYYFLDPRATNPAKILRGQFVLLMLSALINPYLCLMVTGFTLATPAKLYFFEQSISMKRLITYIAASVIAVALVWYLTGMITFGRKEDLGVGGAYGLYSMNLNSLYNAGGFSTFTHAYDWVSWHQYEGFMYLGAGILLLIALLAAYRGFTWFIHRGTTQTNPREISSNKKRLIPLLILVLLYAIFSITLIISFNNKVILRIPAPAAFIHLEEVFRACGRFFWMPYYLIILFTIIGISKTKISPWVSGSLMVAALVIQLYDIKLLMNSRHLLSGTYTPPMANARWIKLMSQFQAILFIPAFESPRIRPMDYQDFSYLALKAGRPVNLAYVARGDSHAARNFNDSLNQEVENGNLSPKALYITDRSHLEQFLLAFQNNSAQLNTLDSCYYIFSKNVRNDSLLQWTNSWNAPVKTSLDTLLASLQTKTEFIAINNVSKPDSGAIHYWLQSLHIGESVISMDGFAFIDSTSNNKGDSIFIVLKGADRSYVVNTKMTQRPDVTAAFKKNYLDDAGFKFIAFTDKLQPGNYQIGMLIKDAHGHSIYDPRLLRGEVMLQDYHKK